MPEKNPEKILVVGAGWLGEPLAHRLQQMGHRLVVTSRKPDKVTALQQKGLAAWRLDLADKGEQMGLFDRLKSFKRLLVAIPPNDDYAAQIERLLAAWPASPEKQLCFISSTSVYPNHAAVFTEKDAVIPDHKIVAAENIVKAWGGQSLVLRCGGLCDNRRVIGRYFAGRQLNEADQPVNYVHLEDVIGAYVWLTEKQLAGIYNVVAPQHPTRLEVFSNQQKRYVFLPFSGLSRGGIDRIIEPEALLTAGYTFVKPDPTSF